MIQERVLPLTKQQKIAKRAAEIMKNQDRMTIDESDEVLNLLLNGESRTDQKIQIIQGVHGGLYSICSAITNIRVYGDSEIGQFQDQHVFHMYGCVWRLVA